MEDIYETRLQEIGRKLIENRKTLSVQGSDWGRIKDYSPSNCPIEVANEFLLCCLIDYRSDTFAAWRNGMTYFRSLPAEDRNSLWKMISSIPKDVWESEDKYRQCGLHWMRPAHNRLWRIAYDVCLYFDGDPRNIWQGDDPFDVFCRLYYIGAGPQISRMIVGALKDCMYITGKGDVKADTHVCRVLARIIEGINEIPALDAVYLARKIYPYDPWLLDWPLWYLGRSKCKSDSPSCEECYLKPKCKFAEKYHYANHA